MNQCVFTSEISCKAVTVSDVLRVMMIGGSWYRIVGVWCSVGIFKELQQMPLYYGYNFVSYNAVRMSYVEIIQCLTTQCLVYHLKKMKANSLFNII